MKDLLIAFALAAGVIALVLLAFKLLVF